VPDEAGQPAPGHEVNLRRWLAAVIATFSLDKMSDALFFIHGFNETCGCRRTAWGDHRWSVRQRRVQADSHQL
jgi:hypothetical protein